MIDYDVNVDRKAFVDDYVSGLSPLKLQKKYCLSPRQYRILLNTFDGMTRSRRPKTIRAKKRKRR